MSFETTVSTAAGSDRGRAGLPARRNGPRTAGAISITRMDQPIAELLLVPVGALCGQARHVEGRRHSRSTTTRSTRRTSSACSRRMKKCAGTTTTPTTRRISSTSCASSSSRPTQQLRAVVRQHHPVLRVDRLHRRPARPDEDRLRQLRHRPRGRPPVVGAPGDRREHAGRRPCWSETLAQYSALMVHEAGSTAPTRSAAS